MNVTEERRSVTILVATESWGGLINLIEKTYLADFFVKSSKESGLCLI